MHVSIRMQQENATNIFKSCSSLQLFVTPYGNLLSYPGNVECFGRKPFMAGRGSTYQYFSIFAFG